MFNNNNNKSNNFGNKGFTNDKQKQFFIIKRAIKFGNIFATIILLVFLVNNFFGGP